MSARCSCPKADGTPCSNKAQPGSDFCGTHNNCKKAQAMEHGHQLFAPATKRERIVEILNMIDEDFDFDAAVDSIVAICDEAPKPASPPSPPKQNREAAVNLVASATIVRKKIGAQQKKLEDVSKIKANITQATKALDRTLKLIATVPSALSQETIDAQKASVDQQTNKLTKLTVNDIPAGEDDLKAALAEVGLAWEDMTLQGLGRLADHLEDQVASAQRKLL